MILDDYKEEFAFMDKVHQIDSEGGQVVTWSQGSSFLAALRFDSSLQAKRAQAEGVQDLYTLIVDRSINLEYNDVVKRLEDGQTFRITSSGKDHKTPQSAGLNMRAVSAKVWQIPDDTISEPDSGGETS